MTKKSPHNHEWTKRRSDGLAAEQEGKTRRGDKGSITWEEKLPQDANGVSTLAVNNKRKNGGGKENASQGKWDSLRAMIGPLRAYQREGRRGYRRVKEGGVRGERRIKTGDPLGKAHFRCGNRRKGTHGKPWLDEVVLAAGITESGAERSFGIRKNRRGCEKR